MSANPARRRARPAGIASAGAVLALLLSSMAALSSVVAPGVRADGAGSANAAGSAGVSGSAGVARSADAAGSAGVARSAGVQGSVRVAESPGGVAPSSAADIGGLIVKIAESGVSVLALARASEEALARASQEPMADVAGSTDVSVGAAIAPQTRVLEFAEPVTQAQAEQAAAQLQSRADVVWAEPDVPVRIASTTPVIPGDPLFAQQWDMWDADRPVGGYSVKAPLIWGTTTGSPDVVVAVIDTGIQEHPDLDAQVLPGYDFIRDIDRANDGDARDSDPADPGDWISASDKLKPAFSECRVLPSSWHGTHVAGTIAATQGNAEGISGVAPGVRILPVRALGKCGGYLSDVIAAMRWAAGDSISGVPANPTPAQVINLSLGTASPDAPCSRAQQEAISFVRSRGTVVVAAAGNDASPVSVSSPADCADVISVTATSRTGALAYYANYGQREGDITLAAPGGDARLDTRILSTFNSGLEGPEQPGYALAQGTSEAAPHVSAAAALLYTLGVTDPSAVERRLIAAVQPFPDDVANACTATRCGAGILDLSRLTVDEPVVTPPQSVKDIAVSWRYGAAAAIAVLRWPAPSGDAATKYRWRVARAGGEYGDWTLTQPRLARIPGLRLNRAYRVQIQAGNTAGWSAPTTVRLRP